MQPVIPQQPIIREGEGYGEAFILPDSERMSAADLFRGDIEKRKLDRLAQDKELQDRLMNIQTLGGKGLPGHRRQFGENYGKLLDWYAQQKAQGLNPSKVGTKENMEMLQRLNALKTEATIMGELYDDVLKNKAVIAKNPNTVRSKEYLGKVEELDRMALSDVNLSNIPVLRDAFNPDKYVTSVVDKYPWTTVEGKAVPSAIPGKYEVPLSEQRDKESIMKALFDRNTEDGEDFFIEMVSQGKSDDKIVDAALKSDARFQKALMEARKQAPQNKLSQQDVTTIASNYLSNPSNKAKFEESVAKINAEKLLEGRIAINKPSKIVDIADPNKPSSGGYDPTSKFVEMQEPMTVGQLANNNDGNPWFSVLNGWENNPLMNTPDVANLASQKYNRYGIQLPSRAGIVYDNQGKNGQNTMVTDDLTYDPSTKTWSLRGQDVATYGGMKFATANALTIDANNKDKVISKMASLAGGDVTKNKQYILSKMNELKTKADQEYKPIENKYNQMSGRKKSAVGKKAGESFQDWSKRTGSKNFAAYNKS